MRTRLTLAPLALVAFVGCSKSENAQSADAGAAAAAASHAVDAGAAANAMLPSDAASASGPCSVDVAPFVVDKGVRGDTGVTLVHLPDDRWAVGYATGEGTPKAAIVNADGTSSVVDVDTSQVAALTTKAPPKTQRTVKRVTPIAAKDLKIRIAVDYAENRPDGTRFVRCGAADEAPLASFQGTSAYDTPPAGVDAGAPSSPNELRDCRTFTSAGNIWTLVDEATHAAAATATASGTSMRWLLRTPGAAPDDAHALLEERTVPPEAGHATPRAGQLDRYGFATLSAVKLGDAGYFVASRSNGKLVMGARASDGSAASELSDFWFNAAIAAPAIATRDAKIVVLAPIAGRLDLYGAAFPVEAKAPKPEKLVIDLPTGLTAVAAETERTSLTAAIAAGGQVVAAFLDGTAGHRRLRAVRLDPTLKAREAVFEPLVASFADADVADVKIAVLADERILVTALVAKPGAGLALEGAVLGCGYK